MWVSTAGHLLRTSSVVELRGDSLGVVRVERFTDAGDAMEWIVVVRSGGDGRIAELVYFDPEDVSSSIAELDRPYSQPT